MKKKSSFYGLLLAGVLLLALIGLAVYLAFTYKEETLRFSSEKAESEADAALAALRESARNSEDRAASDANSKEPFLIWVGDSRTIGMRDAMQNDNLYIGASGEGYRWFSESGLPELKQALKQTPDAPVIFNLGVNDYDNRDNYLALYRDIVSQYPDTPFYFLSVNPIDPERCKNITNEEIADFNAHLKNAFPDSYIDSFTWMMVEEVTTKDGIHYAEEDYRALYEYVVSKL